ncbi:MAG: hypothetical protein M1830_009586 [Pleopsidium flavum]|nr:MAG: hypothetical protein M1830_009586 [Pleopsidium flavum]
MSFESCLGHGTLGLGFLNLALNVDDFGCTQPLLLRLPIEIRLEIYRHLLRNRKTVACQHDPTPFILLTDYSTYIPDSSQPNPSPRIKLSTSTPCFPAILRSNRQIYSEALTVLYAENFFHFTSRGTSITRSRLLSVSSFFDSLGANARKAVMRIRVCVELRKEYSYEEEAAAHPERDDYLKTLVKPRAVYYEDFENLQHNLEHLTELMMSVWKYETPRGKPSPKQLALVEKWLARSTAARL